MLCVPLHGLLAQPDVHDPYRLMSPSMPELETGCVNVYSKLMMVDDDLLLVGSANLNDRPLMLDTQSHIAIYANDDPRIRRASASMCNALLAEHLGCEPEAIAREISARRSMNEAIAVLL